MTTPGSAIPDDFGTWKKEVEKQLRALAQAVSTRSVLNVSDGNFVISGGGSLNVQDGGGMSLFDDEGVAVVQLISNDDPRYQRPDGSAQPMFLLRRDDGSLALSLYDPVPLADDYRQILRAFDRTGHEIFAEDATSGFGLANPTIHYPLYPNRLADAVVSTSATYETVFSGYMQSRAPYYYVGATIWTLAPTEADAQVLVDGDVVGAPIHVTTSSNLDWTIDMSSIDDFTGTTHLIEVQVRRTAGTSTVSLNMFRSEGGASV